MVIKEKKTISSTRKQQGCLSSKGSDGLLRLPQCSSSFTRLLQRLGDPKPCSHNGQHFSHPFMEVLEGSLSAIPPTTSHTTQLCCKALLSALPALCLIYHFSQVIREFQGRQVLRHTRSTLNFTSSANGAMESAASGGHRALPTHLSSMVSLQRGSNPNPGCTGRHHTIPACPERCVPSRALGPLAPPVRRSRSGATRTLWLQLTRTTRCRSWAPRTRPSG